MNVHLSVRSSWLRAAIAAAAIAVPMLSTTAAQAAVLEEQHHCEARVAGKLLGPIQGQCEPKTTYTFAIFEPFQPRMDADEAVPATSVTSFRGWAKTSHPAACGYDRFSRPVVCGAPPLHPPSPDLLAYRYTNAGWIKTTIRVGTWVWAHPYTKTWEWVYTNGAWYAMKHDNLSGYCQVGNHSYSNCTLVHSSHPVAG